MINPIVERLGIVACACDRWQTADITDDLIERKIHVINYTLRYGDHVAWRDDLSGRRILLPRPEVAHARDLREATGPEDTWLVDKPVAQLMRQSIIVVDVPGKTVEKPTEGNNDVYWTAVLARAVAHRPEVRDLLRDSAAGRRLAGAIGAYGGGSGIVGSAHNPRDPRPREDGRVTAPWSRPAPSRPVGVTGGRA